VAIGNQRSSAKVKINDSDPFDLSDEWGLTSLNKGDQVIGGLPGQSSYYTTFDTLEASGSSRETLFQSLQVSPHPEFGYRPKVGVYELQQELPKVPTGTVNANPNLGPGGGDQHWIRDYSEVLKLVDEIDLEP
jgi:filamentous hemagglutinin